MTETKDTTTPPSEIDSISIPKRSVGRPKKYEQGAKQREKDDKYHQKYYHLTNKEIHCEHCGKKITTRTLAKHKKSLKCQFICLTKASNNSLN